MSDPLALTFALLGWRNPVSPGQHTFPLLGGEPPHFCQEANLTLLTLISWPLLDLTNSS